MMQSTDLRQLEAVLKSVVQVLGSSVVGVYQYGSAVMGGLRPFSDLDVLAVVDSQTTIGQRQQLLTEIMPVSGARGTRLAGRPIEVTVVLQSMVKPWHPHQEQEFQYGEWLRHEYETGFVPERHVNHDLAPLLATVLTASVALVGPLALEVIDPIPHEHLVESMRRAIPSLVAELDTDTTNVLLTLARMWCTKVGGLVVTKDEAASWALDRLPLDLRPPLENARAGYLGEKDASLDRFLTPSASAEYMCAEIED